MPLKRKTIVPSMVLLAVMVALLFCSKDYNPFADLTNAKVHVLSWSFADKDSVPLYSTGVIKLVVALHEEVDSFVLEAPKNRFWQKTTVRSGGPGFDGGPYSFSISFYDTGAQEIKVETHRSNGEVIPQVFPIYVRSELQQAGINNLFGKPFTLFTPQVSDVDVMYHWDFGPGRRDSSLSNTYTKTFYYFTPCRDTGRLWVTDLAGKYSTPKCRFIYSFIDTSKPIITCKNHGTFRGDTLLTGDTTLVFRVQIVDFETGQIDYCSINGMLFETEDTRDHLYTMIFNNLPALTRNAPLKLTVFARDNPDSPNVSTRTYWVLFKPGEVTNSLAEVFIVIPSSSQPVANRRDYKIYGEVKSYYTVPQSLTLKMRVNGIEIMGSKTFPGGNGSWVWPVYLDKPSNTIVLKVENAAGDSLAVASKTIMYDPNVRDTIEPLIYEISDSADGKKLYLNTGKKDIGVFTEKSEMTLKIIAFDDGSGIHDIAVNNLPVQLSTESDYIWYVHVANIVHNTQGTACIVRVTDNSTNTSDLTLTLIKNTPPMLVTSPNIPSFLCADSTYAFHLMYADNDNDPVTILWRSRPGSMDTAKNGIIAWRPTTSDLRSDSIIIQGSDGYSYSEPFLRKFEVVECRQTCPVHFVTREQDFPGVLQADHDTLLVHLITDTSVSGLRYSAWFSDRAQAIILPDSTATIFWTPVPADTGYRRLMVTVGNGETIWDTINPAFRVVPKNAFPCSLSYRFTGTMTVNSELDLFSHPAAETLFFSIHDRDDPLTEKYTVSITRNTVNSVQVLDKGDFFIVIKPDSTRSLDTLRVAVRDRTGTTDSAEIVIRYTGQHTNRKPFLSAGPGFPEWFWVDTSYQFAIVPSDSDNDVVDVETILKPTGMTVSLRGAVAWTPAVADTGDKSLAVRFFDGKEYSASIYTWLLPVVNRATLPPGVQFQTKSADFPSVLMVGDSIDLVLSTAAGTGVAPFRYSARFIDNGFPVLSDGTDSLLVWKPSISDTGTRTMIVSVTDRYNRKDSLMPVINVVPRNQYPCSLSYVYSGTMASAETVEMDYPANPETFTFVIHDLDNPFTERYTVDILKDRLRSTQTLSGSGRSFTITVSASTITTVDTVRVKIGDVTGTFDSVTIVIRYIGQYVRSLRLNTTAAGAAVMTNQINFPVLVRLDRNNFDFSKAAGDGGDLAFKKANGVILAHEIEKWDSMAGTAAVWVKVDTVFGNDSTHAIILECNASSVSPSAPHLVFDTANGFCGVWHLDENPAGGAGAIKDRTAFGNNGTPYGTMTPMDQIAGLIGNGMNFNGNNAYVSFGDINQVDGLTKMTASAWIRPSVLRDWAAIIGKANDTVNQWEILESGAGYNNNTNFQLAARTNGAFNTQCGYTTTNPISVGNWLFCVMVFDGTQPNNATRLKFYINGVQQVLTYSTGNISNRLPATTWPVQIARTPIGFAFFQGIIDEAIVARDARSADWVKLCYMNQRAVDALVKVR